MFKIKSNQIALSLVTLFLLCGFSNGVYGQRILVKADKLTDNSPTFSSEEDVSRLLNEKVQPKFFPDDRANNFPPNAGRQTAVNYTYPNADERFRKYVKRTVGGTALIGDVVAAGVAQITDTPKEWENNSKGFGRRLASTFGKSVIKETVTYGLDESFKLDSNYYKSGRKNFNARLKNAVLSTFTARKPDGRRVFGFPNIIGTYTAAVIANQFWYPSNYDYKDGFSSGTISLGVSVGVNFLREFF